MIATLTPPSHHQHEGVVDLQRFMLESMREELRSLQSRENRLLEAAEERDVSQSRVQEAALAILEARSFEHLIRTVNERIAQLLVRRLEPCTVEIVEMLGTTERGSGGFGSTGV